MCTTITAQKRQSYLCAVICENLNYVVIQFIEMPEAATEKKNFQKFSKKTIKEFK